MTEPSAVTSVRRLTEDDWADLRAVRLAMLLDAPFAYGSTYARERDYPESLWRDRAKGTTWLAYGRLGERELPVGAVTLWHAPDQAPGESWLVGMWVAAHARGAGAADALVTALVAEARDLGLDRIVLQVAKDNSRAAGAYRRLGFVETGARSPSPAYEQVCELEMELLLGDSEDA